MGATAFQRRRREQAEIEAKALEAKKKLEELKNQPPPAHPQDPEPPKSQEPEPEPVAPVEPQPEPVVDVKSTEPVVEAPKEEVQQPQASIKNKSKGHK